MTVLSTLASSLDASGLHSFKSAAFFVGVPVGLGFASALTMGDSVKTWYKHELKKPSWTPPPWLFGPVWTSLYISMGYASHRIFHLVPAASRSLPLGLYFGQLALNFAWTPLFFGLQRFGAATVCIGGMWVGIGATAWQFFQRDSVAAGLLLPYWAWVSYASSLTWFIWRNNKGFRNRKQVGGGAANNKGKKKAQ